MRKRTMTSALAALALVVSACATEGADTDPSTSSTSGVDPTTTTTMASTTTTTAMATTTTTVLSPVVLATEGTTTTGIRDGKIVFTLTHDPVGFTDLVMTREPDGILASLGWKGAVWDVEEIISGTETSPGEYRQTEIHRLWPPDQAVDLVWLTDYSGVTKNTLTGYTPEPADTFALFDALTIEGELGQFALHADCKTPEGDVGAALLSFSNGTPEPLMAWVIDQETMTFIERDVEGMEVGDCMPAEPRR